MPSPKPLFPNSRISAISALVSALGEEPPCGSTANKIVIIIIITILLLLFLVFCFLTLLLRNSYFCLVGCRKKHIL